MATKTLLIDETEFIDFRLYGILSAYADSPQFIYHVNRSFDTKFVRCQDLDVLIENQETFYPVFEWEDLQYGTYYNIIKNTAYTLNTRENFGNLTSLFDVAPVLINQYKQYNFLLKVSGEEPPEFPISEIDFIQVVTELDTASIKTINRLIF